MGLLYKCNITNSIIPEYESNEVVFSVLVKNKTQNSSSVSIFDDVKMKQYEFKKTRNYSLPICMKDYTYTGIHFKGRLSGYSGPIVDFTDKSNIDNLKLLALSTRFNIKDSLSGKEIYNGRQVFELVKKEKYQEAWNIIQEALRLNEENIFMSSRFSDSPKPIFLSVISKHVYDKFFDESFMRSVTKTFYHGNLNIYERMNLAKDILEKLKSLTGKYSTINDEIYNKLFESRYLEDLYPFSRIEKKYLTEYAFSNLLNLRSLDDNTLIDIIRNIIFNDYFVCCFEYLQAEFNSMTVCSIEDYQNTYTAKGLSLKREVFNKIYEECAFYDGYPIFYEIYNFKDKYVTYIHDGEIEELDEKFKLKLDIDSLQEDFDNNTLIVYDSVNGELSFIEDHEFMESNNITLF